MKLGCTLVRLGLVALSRFVFHVAVAAAAVACSPLGAPADLGTSASAVTTTITPSADTFVRDGTYASTSYGLATTIEVKNDNANFYRTGFLTFNFSTYSGGNPSSAKLRVYLTASGTDATRMITAYRVPTETWSESVTWNTQPALGSTITSTSVGSTTGTWYEFDVTSYVASNMTDKVVSFALKVTSALSGNSLCTFSSREGAHPPELVITSTGGGPTTPTVITSAASAIGQTAATLNGSADPNGAATTGHFRYATTNPGSCNETFGTRAPSSGGSSLGSGSSAVAYSQVLSGLTASTTYYYCAIANNSAGTGFGSPHSFTTSGSVSGPTAPPQAVAAGFHTLTFDDEFDSASISPDNTGNYNWYTNQSYGFPHLPATGYSVSGGMLKLTDNFDAEGLVSYCPNSSGKTFQWGYFEASLRFQHWDRTTSIPVNRGWPAFWMMPLEHSNGSASRWAELDVMEAYPSEKQANDMGPYKFYGTSYAATQHDWTTSTHAQNCNNTIFYPQGTDYSQFHRYGVLWQPGRTTWYFDDKPVTRNTWAPGATYSVIDAEHMYLILNTAKAGTGTWPMDVDWVRVWQGGSGCTSMTFANDSVSPTGVVSAGSTVTVGCDYGAQGNFVAADIDGVSCMATGYQGNKRMFNCTAPSVVGMYTPHCKVVSTSENKCPRTDDANGRITVSTGMTWVEENSGSITYTGSWTDQTYASSHGGGDRYAYGPATASLTFTGTKIIVLTRSNNRTGNADIYIDGSKVTTISSHTPTCPPGDFQHELYKNISLSSGSHTIKIEPSTSADAVDLDAFEYGP
jgi:beta-glucanase (GH16 family)